MATLQTTGTPTQPAPVQAPSSVPKPLTTQQPAALGVNSAQPSVPPSTPSPLGAGVNTYSTNPASDLRGQTIGVAPTANREQIANTYEQNWNAQTNPQYQADLKSATSQAAGAGQLGSGQLRTSLGDLAYNRDVQRQGQESNFQNTALNGTIQDAYNNVQQADQQQQEQLQAQNQAFNQGATTLQLGQSGNPADSLLALSQQYGNQGSQAGDNLSSLVQNSPINSATENQLRQLLQQYGGGTNAPLPVGTPIYNNGTQRGGVTG